MARKTRWKANPGKTQPRNKERMVWIKFRNGRVHLGRVRAGNWNWVHLPGPFDIEFFTEDDPNEDE